MTGNAGPPSVTVVIPTRNRLSLLREAVDSVRSQTLADWELIIVDDRSDDGSRRWAEQLEDPRVRLLALPTRRERTVARNLGLAEASGGVVVFLDDDDRLTPGALAVLSETLARRPDAIAAVGAAVRFDPRGHVEPVPHPRRSLVRNIWREVLAGWDAGSGAAAFRTSALRELGGWNESLTYWELGDLWFRVARLGLVAFVPTVVLEVRLHPGRGTPPGAAADAREAFVEALPETERAEATTMLRAGARLLAGEEARFRGDYGAALSAYIGAAATAPLLLWSPLTRADLTGNIVHLAPRALLGEHGRAGARQIRRMVRRLRR